MHPDQPRWRFTDDLRALEAKVQEIAVEAQRQIQRALATLAGTTPQRDYDEVIAGDDAVDRLYLDVEHRILDLFALQTPVASDLRLLTSMLHINLHLERIADMAINIAKIARLVDGLPSNPTVLRRLQEMGAITVKMVGATMDALARRDLQLAYQLSSMDDPVDRLNQGMVQLILADTTDRRRLEWSIHMQVVSRQIERIGDHAVDIAEQVAFLITGEFKEFTDASHPNPPSASTT